MKSKGIGGHQSSKSVSDEYLTPPEIIRANGVFDLDPCAPIIRPWDMAKRHYTIEDNSLLLPWDGRIWLNPPYGRKMRPFLEKMALHANGIALVFARTETQDFHKYIWPFADSILFIEGRLFFYDIYGELAKTEKGQIVNGGAPSCLISYGEYNAEALASSGIRGKHIPVNTVPVVVIGISPSWKAVVSLAIVRLNGSAYIKQVYDMVELVAPDKVAKNPHYKEKVRQKLQFYFSRISKGQYTAVA